MGPWSLSQTLRHQSRSPEGTARRRVCRLADFPGLIVKDSYWRWPERGLAGNAIDLLVQVLGRSFHEAMRELNPPAE